MSEEIDREAWDAIWRGRTDRSLPDGCRLDLILSDSPFGKPVMVTIAADPIEFAARVWRESDLCPICGQSTLNHAPIGASLDVQYDSGVGCFTGVWVHSSCLERCPIIGRAAHVPW